MRMIIPVLLFVVILSSCSKYQYLKLSSDNTKPYETNQFVFENDTFRVVYRFNENADVTILNKSARRVVIDWEKSWFSKDTHSFRQPLSGRPIEVIPPYHNTNSEKIKFLGKKFFPVSRDEKKKGHDARSGPDGKIKRISLEKNNTPLSFHVSLSLWIEGEPSTEDRSFYLAEVIETRVKPENMPAEDHGTIVLKRNTVSTVVFGTLALIPLTLLYLYLNSERND